MTSVIIAGSRSLFLSVAEIDAAIARLDPGGLLWYPGEWREIVCGMARGMDLAGKAWAEAKGIAVHKEPIRPSDIQRWGKYLGPSARNHRMARRADAALIFWDRRSRGSADMAMRMLLFDKPVRVVDCWQHKEPQPAHIFPRRGAGGVVSEPNPPRRGAGGVVSEPKDQG